MQIIILDTEFIMRKLCIDCNILSLQFPVMKSINILIKSIVLICIFIEHQVILRCTLIACSQGRESSYLSPTCYCLLYTSCIIMSSIHATSVTVHAVCSDIVRMLYFIIQTKSSFNFSTTNII